MQQDTDAFQALPLGLVDKSLRKQGNGKLALFTDKGSSFSLELSMTVTRGTKAWLPVCGSAATLTSRSRVVALTRTHRVLLKRPTEGLIVRSIT